MSLKGKKHTPAAKTSAGKQGRDWVRDGPDKPAKPPDISAPDTSSITEYLSKLRFKPSLFGGVDKADVWRKIEKLNGLYEDLLRAERLRYDALLQQQSADCAGKVGDE